MKDTFDRAVHLGFGLAATGKEQIERTIDELVKKGRDEPSGVGHVERRAHSQGRGSSGKDGGIDTGPGERADGGQAAGDR